MALIGIPGAGKSATIINKIETHFKNKFEVIILTFSNASRQDLLSKVKK